MPGKPDQTSDASLVSCRATLETKRSILRKLSIRLGQEHRFDLLEEGGLFPRREGEAEKD